MDEEVRARDELARPAGVADVADELVDAPFELRDVERVDVEGTPLVAVSEQASR